MNYDRGRQHDSTGPGSNRPIVWSASTMYLVDVRGVASMMAAHPGRTKRQLQCTVSRYLVTYPDDVAKQCDSPSIDDFLYVWRTRFGTDGCVADPVLPPHTQNSPLATHVEGLKSAQVCSEDGPGLGPIQQHRDFAHVVDSELRDHWEPPLHQTRDREPMDVGAIPILRSMSGPDLHEESITLPR